MDFPRILTHKQMILFFINYVGCLAQEEEEEEYAATADEDLGASREASRTDDEVVKR